MSRSVHMYLEVCGVVDPYIERPVGRPSEVEAFRRRPKFRVGVEAWRQMAVYTQDGTVGVPQQQYGPEQSSEKYARPKRVFTVLS